MLKLKVNRSHLGNAGLTSLLLGLLVLSGCSTGTESGSANIANSNSSVASSVANKIEVPSVQNSSPTPLTNNVAATNGNGQSGPSAVKQPTPHIGSGGDDFSLFTLVRGALSSDKELSTSVIVEIKEGVVTLTGNLSSQAQKAKAESLIRNVSGVKSIRNNLRAP